ncbi:hypothetical protein SGQ44_17025 [Flavobacterium sp. Fl-77]|uniref:Uncharacterized protein n=1 Tax=Flavobacterium flavipigmentatum TaxID=2893884 RepID=A0AAJ2SJR6_9FLAO|nr:MULTISPECIES: hypothetical protein [unclassified Flavobacterium]MDX6183970.1 hypothetical protein [Flavobacterium sp. Fl-33]MDX6187464.1 hypothetical protein [Flavobacterium sp. Fl-77]UFH37695.1 hypothetical protein LNP22_13220 [Flavobacterium sp. F-70]
MKIEKITNIFFIIIILLIIWKVYNYYNPNYQKNFRQNISELQDKRTELNKIVETATLEISRQNIPNKSMDLDDMSEPLREKMEELGFSSFRFEIINNCNKKYRFYFKVCKGWNLDNLNYIEIIFSPCDSETKEGFHSFDGNHIDVFGAGEEWKILSDTDFI